MASVLALVLISLFSYGYCVPFGFPRQSRQEENLFELNALTPRQGSLMQQLLALLQKPEPVDNAQIPAEDPNIRVVRPAGGDVLPGGAAIAGLNLGAGAAGIMGLLPEPLPATKAPEVIIAAALQDMNKQAVVVATTMAPPPPTGPGGSPPPPMDGTGAAGGPPPNGGSPPPNGGSPPPTNGTMAPTPAGSVTTAAPAVTTTAYAVTTAAPVATTTAYAVTTARPGATTTMMNSYGASYASSGGTSGTSYGSSYGSSGSTGTSGTSGTSGSSTSSGSVNSLGVPYGYYTQVQYFPYAQNATSQLTHPIVFSPYLPIPSYINKYFGLNLPLTMGRR